jgi:hypothetical protein
MSENPDLILWDKDGLLNYYAVDFSGNLDWDNLTLNLLRHRVGSDGSPQSVGEERDVRCE